ncbi:hypothetical protein GCM10028796_17140 [Ramlibacter monticola]|uniref:HNH endonuclease n=1 Tax=Ramlibacter monticola TaxID=1926872 RepID=A0A937CRY5_9BURK|nr:HNH endonuclease [Ramlibacter monticola]
MADTDYARLTAGGAGFSSLITQKRGRGRPLGSTSGGHSWSTRYEIKCQRCGSLATVKKASARWCGDKCRNAASNRAKQEQARNSDPRPCRWCGTVYAPEYGSLRTHYCTTECRDAATRKVRSGSSHRRRAEKFGCEYQPVSKWRVFDRDGWSCYLCGRDTPKELSGTTEPNAPELEHVVPLAKGGAHSYENVRCACRRCNRAKGSGLLEG